ncbi:MAG: hypothetical protein KC422_24295, partial [Trueperaceae bacterium]|nr:hypothetical protein [Trueperaceae bacterium]
HSTLILLILGTAFAQRLALIPENETGIPLFIEGYVLDAETNEPIPNAELYLYQVNAEGEYQPSDPSDESTARLNGIVITNAEGYFSFSTIYPGEYSNQPPGNRHIHLHYVRANGYQQRGGIILFEDNVRDEVRQWALETGFGIIIDLTETATGYSGELALGLHKTPAQ